MTAISKILSIFFIIIYLSYVFRVVFPFVDYIINYDYIVNVLCIEKDNPENNCHGKCHLSKELQKQVDESLNKDKTVVIDFIKIPHVLEFISVNLSVLKIKSKYSLEQFKPYFLPTEPLTPPPRIQVIS